MFRAGGSPFNSALTFLSGLTLCKLKKAGERIFPTITIFFWKKLLPDSFLARQWDLDQTACQVRPKDLQLRFFPGNPMPLLLTLPQPPPQLLPFPPLEASHPENHQERGCPVIIFFNILQYSNNISQYSHSNGSLPSQKSYWAGLSRNHFFYNILQY